MQLFVKRSAHAVEVVDVRDGCTVADVLAALEVRSAAPRAHHRAHALARHPEHPCAAQAAPGECLLQNGLPLAAAARPAPAATLALAAPLRGGMTIKVKTLTGREIEVDIEPTDTVERIKERLEEKEGIAPDQQRLIYSGALRLPRRRALAGHAWSASGSLRSDGEQKQNNKKAISERGPRRAQASR